MWKNKFVCCIVKDKPHGLVWLYSRCPKLCGSFAVSGHALHVSFTVRRLCFLFGIMIQLFTEFHKLVNHKFVGLMTASSPTVRMHGKNLVKNFPIESRIASNSEGTSREKDITIISCVCVGYTYK